MCPEAPVVRSLLGALLLLLALALPARAMRPEVEAEVAAHGSARVIVELADPAFGADMRLPGAAAFDERRLDRTRDRVERRLSGRARRRARRFRDLPLLAIEADAKDLAVLEASPEVRAVYLDRLHAPSLQASVPHVGADRSTAALFDGRRTAVAVVDTGVDAAHPTFGGRVVAEACFSLEGDCPSGAASLVGPGAAPSCSFAASCFHGTHVAAIAAGGDATWTGVAPRADIIAVRVFSQFSGPQLCVDEDPCALAYTSDIIAGLAFVRGLSGVQVAAANLSLGGGQFTSQAACDADDPPMAAEFAALRAAGIAPVVAAGNEGFANALGSPACITGAISVGSVDLADRVDPTSNSAPFLSLLANGVNVTSALPSVLSGGALWGAASGTSMAAPHVAGAFAALRSADPMADVDSALTALQGSGVPVMDPKSGLVTPRLQVDAASKALAPSACWNGLDDDGEGDPDFPLDPGCASGFGIEAPACQDGIDNDGDGGIDYSGGPAGEPADVECVVASRNHEQEGCGLGFELVAVLLPLWAAVRRRRCPG